MYFIIVSNDSLLFSVANIQPFFKYEKCFMIFFYQNLIFLSSNKYYPFSTGF
jgi:hypothetical protein